MSYQDNKISQLIEDQLPNFLQEEGPKFVQFVQKYYEWMETSKLEVSVSAGGSIVFDNTPAQDGTIPKHKIKATKQINGSDDVKHVYAEVVNSYLLDNGNYLFYIKEYSEDPNSPQTRGFSSGEVITIIEGDGGSSGTISVVSYIQNATLSSKNLWNLQDIDRTLDDYVDYFMKEYLEGFPLSFPSELQSTDIDVPEFKKFLVKHSREFYQSKGTVDSFKYFFRSFFNDGVDVNYPKDQVLKPSDNTFSRTKTLLLQPNSLVPPSVESQKIKGQTSGVSAYVETIFGIRKGEYDVFQIELNEAGLSGDFIQGENIVLDINPSTIIGTVHYGASSIEALDVEESFVEESAFYIDRNGEIVQYNNIQNIDRGATIQINTCEINSGEITGINVTSGGTGYSVGDEFTFDNTDCFVEVGPRRPLKAVVSKVNNGVIQEVEIINLGKGYIKLPTITKIGTTNISNEVFQFVSQDVGTIKRVRIVESGIKYVRTKVEGYEEDWADPTVYASKVLKKTEIGVELPYLTLDITNPSGNFTVGEIVNHQTTNATGKVVSWNLGGNNKLVLRDYSGTFSSSGTDTIQGATSNETGTVSVASYAESKYKIGNGQSVWTSLSFAVGSWNDNILTQPYNINLDLNSSGTDNVKLTLGSIFDDGGRFLNNNSFLSDVKYIQDSFYYQVYSYLLETSLEVAKYKDLLKRLVHPAGMKMFGKIESISSKQVKMSVSDIKSNVSMHFWDYIKRHSDTVIRDFDFLYSLLILDGSSSSTSLVIEKVVDGGDFSSKQFNLINGINYPIIPQLQFHGSYACDFLTNENTHQNHRFKIKYKNLRPGTLDNNDFYKWTQVTGTVSIPNDSHTVTGYGTTFTTFRLHISNQSGNFTVGEIVNHQTLDGTGEVVSWNSATGELVLTNHSGTFTGAASDIIEGADSSVTGTVLFRLSLNSGDVIAINGEQFTISSITNDTTLVVNNCSQEAVTQGQNIQMIKRVLISV